MDVVFDTAVWVVWPGARHPKKARAIFWNEASATLLGFFLTITISRVIAIDKSIKITQYYIVQYLRQTRGKMSESEQYAQSVYEELSVEAREVVEILQSWLHSAEDQMERLRQHWDSQFDEHLDTFIEACSYLQVVDLPYWLQMEYLQNCSSERLLEAHEKYYGTVMGPTCLSEIVMVLVEKLLIQDQDHDSLSIVEGLVRKGIPDGHTPVPETVYDLTGTIAANYGSQVGHLVTRLTQRFPQRQRLVIRSLLEMPGTSQRWQTWVAVTGEEVS